MEIWKPVVGYEHRYEVSNLGRVRILRGRCAGRILRAQVINSGYLTVRMADGGRHNQTTKLVHRLVLEAFVGPGPEANHKNFDRLDNRLANLEWVSHSGNVRHTVRAGRAGHEKFSNEVVGTNIETGATVRYPSQVAAERALSGRASSAINHCLVGKKKSAYGYAWCRA